MRRKIIAITIIIIGCGFILYPIVGNIINVVRQNSVQTQYNTMVQKLGEEQRDMVKSDAEEYNQRLARGEVAIISTDEDTLEENFDDGSGYSTALDVGSDAIAIINIPKIDVQLPVYRGTNALTLQKGIGHLRSTSLPVGGSSTHCVLTGHTGMPSSVLFTDLNKLVEGDCFYIQLLDEIHAYRVDQIKIVEPNDASDLMIVPGKDYITLLTCYPYGINSHRLLVRGERIPYEGQIDFKSDGTIEKVTEKEIVETSDAAPEKPADNIFDAFANHSAKVNVYGMNLPFRAVLAATIFIAAAAAALVIMTIIGIRSAKKQSHKNKEYLP